ncbi:hypothetical protein PCYB_031910 [Plasmodium cynomolgi strain B]|uniref:Uncharacterized protein n=1 Tax=Plasmodium cynomolgi (strain B) TaxID=1120755 RepID=K6UI81_PLACD|nr:hypothetical protein PCYB_031910 [Plasmodium cynomolgi strain B]GAB64778.1 hypothetical protein PCYB_031910 [Plasmodium cynomolgi strain B]
MEFLNEFNYLSRFGEYSYAHFTDVERRRNKKDDLSFQKSVEVTPNWEALQRVDNLCDAREKEGRVREGEFFHISKWGMQRGGSHLKYHNGGERNDTSSTPTEGEKAEQSQRRPPYRGGTRQLRREGNPSENSPTGERSKERSKGRSKERSKERNKNGFAIPPNETFFYEPFTSLSGQMENKGTHLNSPFHRNSNVDKLLDLEPQQSNHERIEAPPLGGEKLTPLNWDRNSCTLIYLHSGNSKAEGETSKGEPSMNTVLHPKGDLLKSSVNSMHVERVEDPFLNLIDQENRPNGVPFFEGQSNRVEDLTSAMFDSHTIGNQGAYKMDPLGGCTPKKEDLIRTDDFHTRDVPPLGSENRFGGSTNWNAMKRGGKVGDGQGGDEQGGDGQAADGQAADELATDEQAVPFSKKLPVWESSLLEREFYSSLFPMDGDLFAGRETNGGRLHIGGSGTVWGDIDGGVTVCGHMGGSSSACGHTGETAKDEQTNIGDEELMGRDYNVEKPHQWGKSHTVDLFQMVNSRRGGKTPPDSRIMKNSTKERIKLQHELINLSSDGSTSEMDWTRKGTAPRGEPNVGWLPQEEGCHIDGFNMMGEERTTEGGKNPLWGKHDFFDFEHGEEVGASERGRPDWIGDISKRMTSREVGNTKGESRGGLLTAARHRRDGKADGEAGEREEVAEKEEGEEDVPTYHDHYLTEKRIMEEAAPMEDECSSFLDIIDEIVSISKDIIGTNQNEDGVVETLQRSPDEGTDYSQIGEGHLPRELQMGLHLGVALEEVVEPAEQSTHAGVYKDPPEDIIVDDVYAHFEKLIELCRKGEEPCDEVVTAKGREGPIHGAVCGAVHAAVLKNPHSMEVNTQQVAPPCWRNRSGETKGATRGIQEEDPQEDPQEEPQEEPQENPRENPQDSPTCGTASGWEDPPTMELCEGLYRVLMCRDYLEALPVLAAHTGGKRADGRPISEISGMCERSGMSELSGMIELSGKTHCGAGNYPSDGPLPGNVSLVTFHTYLRRAKKMNKRGFTEMYDYSDYVYTHMQKIFQMDITRFFFTSNYLENMNRYIIKKNKLINDLTNAKNFINNFLQKKENVVTQKKFCNDVTYPMYFLIFTNLLVTLWHRSFSHLEGAKWNQLVWFLIRRLRKKTTICVLRRSYSLLSRIYQYLTKYPLDEKQKKKIISIVKRSRSFKMVQKNVHKINTFCFYVLIFFLPLSVPPFGKDLNTRDYFLHCFLRNFNKVVLRYAKEHTSDGRRSENMRDIVRKAVSSSKKNICRLKMQSLGQVFRCSFEDAPRGGRPVSGSTSSHAKGQPNRQQNGLPNRQQNGLPNRQQNGLPNRQQNGLPNRQRKGLPNRQPNGLPNRQPNNLVDAVRDIHISARIEQIEKELTAYLRANAHFHDTFFNVIVPLVNGLTILLENLEMIFALYVKHRVRKSRKLLFFRNPWLCSYDVFLSFTQSGGPAPNYAEKSGMATVTRGVAGILTGSLTGSLTDDSADSPPTDFAAYIAQQDRQLAQDDLGALYDFKRAKEMLLLGSREKGTSRRNTDGADKRRPHKRGPHKQNDLADRDRANHAKLNAYYSYILKLCHDERYKEINTRALRCLFYSLYFS